MRVLAIPGSLRNDSYNAKLLYNAVELFPEDVVLDLWGGLKDVPPYDEDDDGVHAPVAVAPDARLRRIARRRGWDCIEAA